MLMAETSLEVSHRVADVAHLHAMLPSDGRQHMQLEQMDERVGKVSVPLSYADELYALRNNIGSVRRKLEQA